MAADTADWDPGAPGGDDAAGLATGTDEVATNFGSTGAVDGDVTGGLEPVTADRTNTDNASASGTVGLGNAGAAGNTGTAGAGGVVGTGTAANAGGVAGGGATAGTDAGGTGAPGGGASTGDTGDTVGTTPPTG